MTRRRFMTAVPVLSIAPLVAGSQTRSAPTSEAVHPEFPSQNPVRVREFVAACHGNVARVKEMLEETPNYALATYDWGFGDWETGLGAASHVGNREIAQLLVANGARPDLFYHAMMGHLDAVKSIVASQPGVQRIPGPHGITLLAHARFGGAPAKETAAYLESLGDADMRPAGLAITDGEKARYVGSYRFGDGNRDLLVVETSRQGDLMIKRGDDGIPRGLTRVEEDAFSPAGNRRLRVRFQVESERAFAVGVFDPGLILEAKRI